MEHAMQLAAKLFSDEISVNENIPEILFDLYNDMDIAIVRLIRGALKDRRLDYTTKADF